MPKRLRSLEMGAYCFLLAQCKIMKHHSFCSGHRPKVVIYSLEQKSHALAIIRIIAPMLANNWNVIWAGKQTKSGYQIDTDIALNADLIVIQREFPSELTLSALRKII